MSLDYYNITVDDVITSPTVQQALNACYDAPSLDNQFCALFKRDNAAGDATGTPFRIIDGTFIDQPAKLCEAEGDGLRRQCVNFNRDFGFVKAAVKWHLDSRDPA